MQCFLKTNKQTNNKPFHDFTSPHKKIQNPWLALWLHFQPAHNSGKFHSSPMCLLAVPWILFSILPTRGWPVNLQGQPLCRRIFSYSLKVPSHFIKFLQMLPQEASLTHQPKTVPPAPFYPLIFLHSTYYCCCLVTKSCPTLKLHGL